MLKNYLQNKQKVLVALSGGVDSAVSAALLLKKGYKVEAVFMKNWTSNQGLISNECPWLEDRRSALQVAAHLRIPLHTFDFEKEYSQKVMEYFFNEYAAGRTPNPDVMCNKEIKFKLLYERAMQMGFDFLATGHYARIKNRCLLRAKDEFKDQTYFIYNLQPEQLKHILFPIGGYLKSEVRAMARKFGLPNAGRKESMGLCFVGKVELDKFLQQKIAPKKGPIVEITSGDKIGEHQGAAYYTLGQRQGIGVGGSGPYYVVRKELQTNTLVVSKNPEHSELLKNEIEISAVNWISRPGTSPLKCRGRFRHQQQPIGLELRESGQEGKYHVRFFSPQRAVAAGQSLVMYKGKICLGGGVIV